MGRHTHPDDIDDEPVQAPPAPTRNKTSAVADLHVIMRSPRLSAACVAAVVLPFLCYFAIIVGLHKTGDWALFIGAPMVLSGVLIGALLDRAYDRFERQQRAPHGAAPAESRPDAETSEASAETPELAAETPEPAAVSAEPVSVGAGQSASE